MTWQYSYSYMAYTIQQDCYYPVSTQRFWNVHEPYEERLQIVTTVTVNGEIYWFSVWTSRPAAEGVGQNHDEQDVT